MQQNLDNITIIEKKKITDIEEPFVLIPASRKMLFLKGVGRLCECGCNQIVIGPKHKKFINRKHKDKNFYNTNGRRISKKTVLASLAINVNYDNSRNISIYFKRGVKTDIRFSRNNCKELWDALNQISEFRNKPL